MVLTLKFTNKLVDRPWGTECRVDFADETGRIYNEELCWPLKVKVDEKMVDNAIEERRLRLEEMLAHPPKEEPSETEKLRQELAVKDIEIAAKAEEIRALKDEVETLKARR